MVISNKSKINQILDPNCVLFSLFQMKLVRKLLNAHKF